MKGRIWRMAAALAGVSAMMGCDKGIFGTACTDDARPGLLVAVRDSVTSAAISEARVVARLDTAADTARFPIDGTYALAYEKAGVYTVSVEQAGYREWTRANVRVTSDDCHVRTVSLTALLQPQP